MRAPNIEERPAAPALAEAGPRTGRADLYIAASVVALGSTASILSSTVVNVAVPDLQRVFGASLTDVQWVMSAYLLGLASVIPVSGYVSDRFGTRRVYLLTLLAFTIASGLCGAAWNLPSEIGFRVIQGLAGGMVMPVGMTILMSMAPATERGRMMAVLGVPMMLAPALGPTVGGWLIQAFSWQWVFWVNIPVGILALIVGYRLLRDLPRRPTGPLDRVGLVLAMPGVALIIYGLTQASDHGWGAAEALIPLGLGVALVAAFTGWELRSPHPLLDLAVFRDRGFAGAMVVNVILASALFGAVFLVPVFMQEVQGFDTLRTGLLLAPQGIAAAAAMPISGLLTDRFGAKPVVFFGILVLVAATVMLTGVTPTTTNTEWITILALRGIGMGFAMMPAFAAAYVTLAPPAIARATALSNTVQRVASSLGIAVLATIVQTRVAAHLPGRFAHAQGAGGTLPANLPPQVAQQIHTAVAMGFGDTFWVAAVIALCGLPAALLLRRPLPPGEAALRADASSRARTSA